MKKILFIIALIYLSYNAYAQSAGVVPFPSMNTTQRNAIVSPIQGQVVIISDSGSSVYGPLQYYNSGWKSFTGSASLWTKTGNYDYPLTLSDSVGIGTATPKAKLSVVGSMNVYGLPSKASALATDSIGLIDTAGKVWKLPVPSGSGITNPMTTLGDGWYGGASGTPTRLAGNTTTARQFWTSQGTGSAAQAPTLSALVSADIPLALQASTTATTNPVGDNSIKVATDSFVNGQQNAYGAPKLRYVLTSKTQIINTTTPTTLIGFSASPIGSSASIPAYTLVAGSSFHVEGWMYLSMGSTADSLTISFYLGSQGDSVKFLCTPSVNNQPVQYSIDGLVRSTGTSGVLDMQGWITVNNGTKLQLWNSAAYTVNTTIANSFNMLGTFTVASSSNSITNFQCKMTTQ